MVRSLKTLIKKVVDNFLGYEIVNKEIFGNNIERDILTILNGKKNITAFDIGANIGDTSIEFEGLFKDARIYSFEPDTNTFNTLKSRVSDFKNVNTYNIGFGNTNDIKSLNINKGTGGNSFLDLSPEINKFVEGDWTKKVGELSTQIKTLDSFCEENNINNIDLIKIDTQGYELLILEGAKQIINSHKTKLIYIEVLFVELYKQQGYFHEIYAELISRGFKLVGFYNKFYKDDNGYLLWCDALFMSDEVI